MRKHLSFGPQNKIGMRIVADAITSLRDGQELEASIGLPSYPDNLADRMGIQFGPRPLDHGTYTRIVDAMRGEVITLTERRRTPETKLDKIMGEIALWDEASAPSD